MDFVRVTSASHLTTLADPVRNAQAAVELLKTVSSSDVVVFPELSLSGYTCGDLFAQGTLLEACLRGLTIVAEAVGKSQIVVVGVPLRVEGRLYNCAAVIQNGRVAGVVPKQFLPNYQEFYEARWFAAADGGEPPTCNLGHSDPVALTGVPFGVDLLFRQGPLTLGVEMCEDLWMPIPPSSSAALAGANVIVNLSASNELIGKADWRETLIRSQSGRCLCAYAYASAGPSESTTDTVFSGHCMIAENGTVLAKSVRVGDHHGGWLDSSEATADIDLARLAHDRAITTSWQRSSQISGGGYRFIELSGKQQADGTKRHVSGTPFVPPAGPELDERCAEIFGIQVASLARRVQCLPADTKLNIGVSGGLDSTLALLVAVKTCREMGWSPRRIAGVTMPGFGTTDRTLTAARALMKQLEITADEIDIRQMCLDTFIALGHRPFGINPQQGDLSSFETELAKLASKQDLNDLVFENVQARMRTLVLMSRGFVLGTGDLSEQALGWSTYNGDHMSMYNVNASIPKTLVRFLVNYISDNQIDGEACETLKGIVDTPISPELLPAGADGAIKQFTEDSLGAYELHDFFLYHMVRFGAGPDRIMAFARLAEFSREYTEGEIRQTLHTFLRRFFTNQFKRSCVPDGPKVGSVSLSPRGDWRMPSDAVAQAWLDELEAVS
ncbi:MAG TPA: NAD(+) synthase [Planctomycetaceae bacterium]|nr:NAD(+) synthase [Planctomycetaceae bacterium]